MAVEKDFRWIGDRYSELQHKYPSQYVAIKDGKVVAHGRDIKRVYESAKRKVKKGFVTEYIFSGQPLFVTEPVDGNAKPIGSTCFFQAPAGV